MLQYVQELGCVFNARTVGAAARRGDLEALRYLHGIGTPWNSWTLAAAVQADSLPCLVYAHTHCCPQNDQGKWFFYSSRACSLPVLRYVCDHMDPAFAAKVVDWTSDVLSHQIEWRRWASKPWEEGLDWPLVLYLGRKLGPALPAVLAEAKATQAERAAALAGVFWKAKKQLYAEGTKLLHREAAGGEENKQVCKRRKITCAVAERMTLWDAMARVPKELQECIAVEAHLIIR
jgi:hypothetical protein